MLPVNQDKNVTENREIYVGGSDVPTILGLNKYKTQFELAQEKVGIVKSEFKGNEYTHFGNVMEPQIRDYINLVNETDFKPDTKTDKNRYVRSNTDGYDFENNMILEIKTHGANPTLKVYEAQMQLYMAQYGCEYGWLALYNRPDNFDTEFDSSRLKIEVVERDDEYVNQIYEAIETFWIRCEFLRDNPKATEQEFYNFGQNEVQVIANQVSKLEIQLAGFKEIEKQYKEAKQKLHDAMEEYDIKKFETDHIVITRVLPTERKSIDSTRLKKELPDIASRYERVSKVSGSVRIKLKEAN
ncbi:endonuclease [Pueribacillus theae]|uniref:Endonuclease n=1 Tax=Pueribacillus theae TaxID=2171751 RepID=A0A2U1JUN4_9BACI|nr:endonuclease [Pueribacillus theae]